MGPPQHENKDGSRTLDPEQAAMEAEAVLESINSGHLDQFNLLGVIANPRGNSIASSASPTAAAAAAAASAAANPNQAAGGESVVDIVTGTYHSLETTIGQVTEQIEALNQVFEGWSRQYLEDYYFYTDLNASENEVPASQLQPHQLPEDLVNANWTGLPGYLQNARDVKEMDVSNLTKIVEDGEELVDVTDIPAIFFDQNFDLTDPKTFSKLLLCNDSSANDHDDQQSKQSPQQKKKFSLQRATPAKKHAAATKSTSETSLNQPTQDLFPLPPQDNFTGLLDKIELALLQQVRRKSGAFFQETTRFGQIKELVLDSLQKVQRIQLLHKQQHDQISNWEQIPGWDRQRNALRRLEQVLEGANEVIRVRAAIGGLLSAKDDLSAVEQIHYGRLLLSGETDDLDDTDETQSSALDLQEDNVQLGRLHALRTIEGQLTQYETLVRTNLTEELVEAFLEWSPLSYGSNKPPTSSQQEVERRVLEIISSLSRNCKGSLAKVVTNYGGRLGDVVRMTVRTTVAEFASDESSSNTPSAPVSVSAGVSAMSLERFMDCLDMLFEQLLSNLTSSAGVVQFCKKQQIDFHQDESTSNHVAGGQQQLSSNKVTSLSTTSKMQTSAAKNKSDKNKNTMDGVVTAAAELSSKSVAELLRLRKETHSLVSLNEMKRIWDTCLSFTTSIEELSEHKAVALRSMLLAQAKAFVERKHESNMSALVAALDSERWVQCEVSAERQATLTRLCSGRAIFISSLRLENENAAALHQKHPEAEVEGTKYKVVWSCLLLVEMIMTNIACAAHFQSLASNIISKIAELLRLFNSRTTHLVLGAGAIHSAARLKSINAKHLSLVTQCLGMVIAILPHVRGNLMAQLPTKQHTLLNDLDKIKKEFSEHNENVLNKFVTIIGGIVEHGLARTIGGTNFDARAKQQKLSVSEVVACCTFLDGVVTNTRKMHQVLSSLLPPDHLQDVFSRIFAYIDQKIPLLFITAAVPPPTISNPSTKMNSKNNKSSVQKKQQSEAPSFEFPATEEGKRRMLLEVDSLTITLNNLKGVHPWDFTAINVLEKKIEYKLIKKQPKSEESTSDGQEPNEDKNQPKPEEPTSDGQGPSENKTEEESSNSKEEQGVESNSEKKTSLPPPESNGEMNGAGQ